MESESAADLLRAHRGERRLRDERAFPALVRRFETPLLRYARCLCGDAAEDTVQEVFLRLANHPPELPDKPSDPEDRGSRLLAAWLYRVTRNCAMELLRSEKRRRSREAAAATNECAPDDLQRIAAADAKTAVERALARLPDDQREVLVLRLLADRSYQQIAEITGKKVGTVGWLIAVGMSVLSRDLKDLSPSLLLERGTGGAR